MYARFTLTHARTRGRRAGGSVLKADVTWTTT